MTATTGSAAAWLLVAVAAAALPGTRRAQLRSRRPRPRDHRRSGARRRRRRLDGRPGRPRRARRPTRHAARCVRPALLDHRARRHPAARRQRRGERVHPTRQRRPAVHHGLRAGAGHQDPPDRGAGRARLGRSRTRSSAPSTARRVPSCSPASPGSSCSSWRSPWAWASRSRRARRRGSRCSCPTYGESLLGFPYPPAPTAAGVALGFNLDPLFLTGIADRRRPLRRRRGATRPPRGPLAVAAHRVLAHRPRRS